ncbi:MULTISPECIES: hypothetical protein [Vibrio]|uniref:hypothetical protein n=1 Tax=Vibrio TaxID=662 RepID=UPI000B5D0625|nr:MULTISPECIES: hypothetical protein [Vibrio]HBV76003.1 hypothetical protein [Vibrio sp.]
MNTSIVNTAQDNNITHAFMTRSDKNKSCENYYSLENAESLADDISNIGLLVNSGSVKNAQLFEALTSELLDKVEELQTVLTYIRVSPMFDQEQQKLAQ